MNLNRREAMQGLGAAALATLPMSKLALAAPTSYPNGLGPYHDDLQTGSNAIANAAFYKHKPTDLQRNHMAEKIRLYTTQQKDNLTKVHDQTVKALKASYDMHLDAGPAHAVASSWGAAYPLTRAQHVFGKVTLDDRKHALATVQQHGIGQAMLSMADLITVDSPPVTLPQGIVAVGVFVGTVLTLPFMPEAVIIFGAGVLVTAMAEGLYLQFTGQ